MKPEYNALACEQCGLLYSEYNDFDDYVEIEETGLCIGCYDI